MEARDDTEVHSSCFQCVLRKTRTVKENRARERRERERKREREKERKRKRRKKKKKKNRKFSGKQVDLDALVERDTWMVGLSLATLCALLW